MDKYLKLLVKKNEINNSNNNNENNDLINIDPLDPSNFKNNIEDKDIYEKMDLDFMHQMDVSYGLVEPKMMSSNHSNKNNEKINFIPLNSTNISGIKGHISEDSKSKEKDKKYNNNIKNKRKNKKKNTTSLADVIFNGEF